MKIAVQTKFPEVIDRINVLLRSLTYADPNDFTLRSILRDCKKVRDVDPAFGWSLLSLYYSITGDHDQSDQCFRASQALENLPVACENYHVSLSNSGFFSKAHQVFKTRGHPETGMFSGMAKNALTSGSIQTFLSYFEAAEMMNMELPEFPVAEARRVAAVLDRAGISDEQVTRHLDAAGEVLRRHRLFFQEEAEVEVSDDQDVLVGVTYIFRLGMIPAEVFEINLELAIVEEEMAIQKSSAFDVMFLPV